MTNDIAIRRIASRAAANLVAVIAISAIFGLKAYIDSQARAAAPMKLAHADAATYDPYLIEQP
jgi:hypothetical protein